jgi:subtilisin family serine protease
MPLKGYDGDDPIYRLDFSDITNISYNGDTYNSNNPGPSGWTESGVEKDFGVRFGLESYPKYSAALAADVLDAVEDGIIVIGAAGNENLNMVRPTDIEWNNTVFISGLGNIFYNRGGSPNTADSGSIIVGNLSNFSDFRRASSSMFGTAVDIFAPGTQILSSFNSNGLEDSKYGGDPNYFYPISGTSMASPQVAGVAACLATNKTRFTNDDVRKYLNDNSIENDITFNSNGGDFDDPTCQKGSPNKYLHIRNPRKETGQIEEIQGLRKSSGQTFPRRRFT